MHLLIISSASSTPKTIEVSKRHRNSPVTERPVRDICTKISGQIYDGAERSWKHGRKSGIAEVQAFVF